ncbi:uncharacterized protein LOC129803555 isoform X2 [Phlebotomus papatasi]|uniref:uncharacterized protein LOC129803555 isoform X2 n=1 Tax=Phlebotomus papatasi TaxID=29031 RepID=UPI0024844217|nr:uncharacterized protein LOC129803555 isoform X2 [Phlebotomus papatasi]
MFDSEELMDWHEEASAIINDVKAHLKTVQVSERLESTDRRIYINATTLEGQNLCICVSSMGFRIVDISPLYVKSFGEALQKAMETLAEGSA